MNKTIDALPPVWAAVAYTILGLGLVFVIAFLARYMSKLPWASSEEGRHLVSFSACVGAFFVLYLILAIWPDFPAQGAVKIGLLIVLVINCGWRWWLLERNLRNRRRIRSVE